MIRGIKFKMPEHIGDNVASEFTGVADVALMLDPAPKNISSLQAIKNGALENNAPIFQPILDTNGNVFAFECLSRPVDNDGKPHSIQALANTSYDLDAKGRNEKKILFDTITCITGLKAAAKEGCLPITLNISVASALDPKFFDNINQEVHELGLNPEQIIFEILEHDVDPNANTNHLKDLREMRYRFALDDFGLGEKFDHQLKVFGEHVDYIKIAGEYICGFLRDNGLPVGDNEKCVDGLYEIFEKLGRHYGTLKKTPDLIAEHANTPEDMEALTYLDFSYFQGKDLKTTLEARKTCQPALLM